MICNFIQYEIKNLIYNKMKILTFDIEDWYNCDFSISNSNWDSYEVRIYKSVDKILTELAVKKLKATFFCLGWLAENHPNVIRMIHNQGHQIACHSYKHELSYNFDPKGFKNDTEKAKKLIEDVIGVAVTGFRAPGFSIKKENVWAFEILADLGFEYDCSIFPAYHDYGGFLDFGKPEPVIIELPSGRFLKEFPMSPYEFFGNQIVYSGGGYFRLLPYNLIKYFANNSKYIMTYFHPRDFDPGQPILMSLPFKRRLKSYYGLKNSFVKFQRLLADFSFVNINEAESLINWNKVRIVKFDFNNLV